MFISEIFKQRDFAGLVCLEDIADLQTKKIIWATFDNFYRKSDKSEIYDEIKAQLKIWAAKYPDYVRLFPYQPNTVELYMRKAEDTESSRR